MVQPTLFPRATDAIVVHMWRTCDDYWAVTAAVTARGRPLVLEPQSRYERLAYAEALDVVAATLDGCC
jgi:hypothetical protein